MLPLTPAKSGKTVRDPWLTGSPTRTSGNANIGGSFWEEMELKERHARLERGSDMGHSGILLLGSERRYAYRRSRAQWHYPGLPHCPFVTWTTSVRTSTIPWSARHY